MVGLVVVIGMYAFIDDEGTPLSQLPDVFQTSVDAPAVQVVVIAAPGDPPLFELDLQFAVVGSELSAFTSIISKPR